MAYKAKDGRTFGNSQQGKRYDEVKSEKPAISAHEPTLDEQKGGESIACPHCGEKIELNKAEEAKESPEFEHGEHEGVAEYGAQIPGLG
jgi:hypothetical protein